ncbi:unnamed protein product [Adineta steineri]|uniref:long-chain-fatty-acid--CoA ligase n=1 Tax=Adineta steineri TaxID=433720 RepID=A0A819LCN1_9BILA|nr:unnamed protein product [Adineta steineri]CAF3963927.1 unnamed protein product [Adineta steineri]
MSINGIKTNDIYKKSWINCESKKDDLSNQTVEIDPNEHIRRSQRYKDVDIWTFYKLIYPNVCTLGDLLLQGLIESKDGPCIGRFLSEQTSSTTDIEWFTYSAIIEQCRLIGTYLWSSINLTPMISKVVIFSANRLEHICVEHACYMYGFIVIGLHSTSDSSTVRNVLVQSQASVLIVDDYKRISSFLEEIWKTTNVIKVITMDDVEKVDQKLENISNILKKTKTSIKSLPKIDPDSMATFMLTSGTTGEPKMAMLTHENILATVKGEVDRRRFDNISIKSNDRHLSFLPMTHCFERTALLNFFVKGGQVVFCPSKDKLFEYMAIVKPTRICMVPRVLNNIYEQFSISLTPTNKSPCDRISTEIGISKDINHADVDKTDWKSYRSIFQQVKQMFGGEVKSVLSGAAPIAPEVLEFFRLALDATVTEGYAQTESAAAGAWTHAACASNFGTVGVPMPTVEIKLTDVDGTLYKASNHQGEIKIRGPTIFKGYYGDEAKTREIIDGDGWLHTGDIGEWTSLGTLRIIDRCKNIFKLNNGKHIAPEPLERIYLRSPWIAQIFVDGNSDQSSVVAIIVPDELYLNKHFSSSMENKSTASLVSLCQNSLLKQIIHDDLIRLAKQYNLHHCEIPSNIYLDSERFTHANGLLTPTMKIRRVVARQRFHELIKQLYTTTHSASIKHIILSKM